MKKRHKMVLVLGISTPFLLLPQLLRAGGPPTPTPEVLQDIFDKLDVMDMKLDWLLDPPCPVQKTGQHISYRPGDDGYYQKGIGWTDERFTDHGNGTVTDHFTSLMWLKDFSQFGQMLWEDAVDTCYNLDYAGHQDWRLANIKELDSLKDYSQFLPRLVAGNPFTGYAGIGHDWCWSSTSSSQDPTRAQVFSPGAGDVGGEYKAAKYYKCWCVRGGQ